MILDEESDKDYEETLVKYTMDFTLFCESHGKDAFPCKMSHEAVHNFRECELFH